MTYIEMAKNILNSDMDINLKKVEIGKLKNQAHVQKTQMNGLSVFCVVFGITIFPLLLLPFTIKTGSLCKQQIKQIDELLIGLETAK